MNRSSKFLLLAALAPFLLTVSPATGHIRAHAEPMSVIDDQEGKDKDKWEKRDKRRDKWNKNKGVVRRNKAHKVRGKGTVHPYNSLKIPPGHLPPPGECRLWYPNRPPGHQPAPQPCATIANNVPPGAWIVTHQGDRYRVNMYNPQSPNVVDRVRYYWLR